MKEIYIKVKELLLKEKYTILIIFIMGMVTGFPLYSNYLPNPDTILNNENGFYMSGYWELMLGRWGLLFLDRLFGGINSPMLSTATYMFLLSLTFIFIFDIFHVDNKLVRLGAILLILLNPSCNMFLTYYYCSYAYQLAFLLSVSSIWIFCNFNLNWKTYGITAILITGSLSLYQSYVTVAAVLIIFVLLYELLENITTIKEISYKLLKFVSIGISGSLLYMILLKIALAIFQTNLGEYKGANKISVKNSINYIIPSITRAYSEFFDYYFGNSIMGNHFNIRIFYMLIMILSILLIIIRMIQIKKISKFLLGMGFIGIIPLCANLIDLVATDAKLSIQATSGLFIIMPIMLIINATIIRSFHIKHMRKLVTVILFMCIALLSWSNMLQSSVDVLALEAAYKQTTSLANRIVYDIDKQTRELGDIEVAIIGSPKLGNYPVAQRIEKICTPYAVRGLLWETVDCSWNIWNKILKNELGVYCNWVALDDYIEITKTETFENMGVYPEKSSITIINKVLVVKVSEINEFK